MIVSDAARKVGWLQMISGLEDQLADYLPPYMVPSAFFPIDRMPLTISGKANRKLLRTLKLTIDKIKSLRVPRTVITPPVNR